MKSFLCGLILSCAVDGEPHTPVDDLQYGTVLYAYFQEDYQQALLDSLVAEERGLRGDNPVRFELANGSFAFAEGMYSYAEQTFDSVADEELTQLDRMRLSFHLAREYFRRGDWNRVDEQLAIIDLGKTWYGRERFHPEVEFMRAELAVSRGDFTAAQDAIDHIDVEDPLRAYSLFNLAVALRDNGELEAASLAFRDLAEMDVYDDQALDLKQRAQLALAFVAREQTETTTAEQILGDLPAEGRYRDLALTSYGGLAMDNGDFPLAARIFMTLTEEPHWTASTATARIAFPMSLEQMASTELALAQYRLAEDAFEARLAKLGNLTTLAEDPAWVGGLLKVFAEPRRDDQAMSQMMEEWREQLGHTDWLEWLATEDVHELLLEWTELNGIATWLERLPHELDTFDELTTEQRRRASTAREMMFDKGLVDRRDALAAEIDATNARVVALEGVEPTRDLDWMLLLANDEQARLLEQLAEMREVFAHAKKRDQKRLLKKVDKYEGLIFWQLVEDRPTLLRELAKNNREQTDILADVDHRLTRIQAAEASFVAGVETNFLAFQSRADDITENVVAALGVREAMLAEQIRGGMRREMLQVQRHLLITRIAIARATDHLALSSIEVEDLTTAVGAVSNRDSSRGELP